MYPSSGTGKVPYWNQLPYRYSIYLHFSILLQILKDSFVIELPQVQVSQNTKSLKGKGVGDTNISQKNRYLPRYYTLPRTVHVKKHSRRHSRYRGTASTVLYQFGWKERYMHVPVIDASVRLWTVRVCTAAHDAHLVEAHVAQETVVVHATRH